MPGGGGALDHFLVGNEPSRLQKHIRSLKVHCRDADWITKTIKKKRIRPDSVISLYSEIHEDANDLFSFFLETKHDPRA